MGSPLPGCPGGRSDRRSSGRATAATARHTYPGTGWRASGRSRRGTCRCPRPATSHEVADVWQPSRRYQRIELHVIAALPALPAPGATYPRLDAISASDDSRTPSATARPPGECVGRASHGPDSRPGRIQRCRKLPIRPPRTRCRAGRSCAPSGSRAPPSSRPGSPVPRHRRPPWVPSTRRARSRRRPGTSARAGRRPRTSRIRTSSPWTRCFNGLRQPNTPIQRLWTGALWSEGPAWNGQGRYLVWSDIPNNRQLRWLEDDGQVSVFRLPSNNSNGNTFDFQGRQLSCEHLTRRVVRYEHDGSITMIADSVQGQAAELAQRRGRASRRQLLVHRSALRRPALRGHAGRGGRAEQPAGRLKNRAGPAG